MFVANLTLSRAILPIPLCKLLKIFQHVVKHLKKTHSYKLCIYEAKEEHGFTNVQQNQYFLVDYVFVSESNLVKTVKRKVDLNPS